MATQGLSALIESSTNDSAYSTVNDLNSASMSISGNNIDVTDFESSYIDRIQGVKDCTWSISGFYNDGDTGQDNIRDALLNNTAIYIRIKYNGTNGFKQQVRVSSFEQSMSPDGTVEVSYELEGTGAVSTV